MIFTINIIVMFRVLSLINEVLVFFLSSFLDDVLVFLTHHKDENQCESILL
jgi:hypothetical protein